MEQEKQIPQPNYDEQFDKLIFNGFMKIPMSKLTPITVDDYKSPETEGPFEIFKKGNIYYIDDGNHRYFKQKRELLAKNNYKEPDLSKVMVEIKKINPQKAINSWMLDY